MVTPVSLLEAKVATYRKRNGKWQAIVRHKDIGTITRSFKAKSLAVKWVAEQDKKFEASVLKSEIFQSIFLRNSCKKTAIQNKMPLPQ